MNTNENKGTCEDTLEDVIELGVASVETKGPGGISEANGFSPIILGISEE